MGVSGACRSKLSVLSSQFSVPSSRFLCPLKLPYTEPVPELSRAVAPCQRSLCSLVLTRNECVPRVHQRHVPLCLSTRELRTAESALCRADFLLGAFRMLAQRVAGISSPPHLTRTLPGRARALQALKWGASMIRAGTRIFFCVC